MKNRKEVGQRFCAQRRISNCLKDREEELSFFRDLKKHDKDQLGTLLQQVSEEFDITGNDGLYKMDYGGRKGMGIEFPGENGKNDYNWLKTPPATPLFPSLEMETNGQELVIHREIPIIHPLSRFAGKSEANKTTTNTSSPSQPYPELPHRHTTPIGRPSVSSLLDKKNMKAMPLMALKTNQTCTNKTKLPPKEIQLNIPSSKTTSNSNSKPISRGPSPFVRPKITQLLGQTPPNLRTTNRATSATRGRPVNQTNGSTSQKQETYPKTKRQSCSPSMTRGRKSEGNAADSRNRGQILGSKMVERFMNARLSNAGDRKAKIEHSGSMNEGYKVTSGEERHGKIKVNGSMNESSGFGRLMSKSSLDMARKHKELQGESSNSRKQHLKGVMG